MSKISKLKFDTLKGYKETREPFVNEDTDMLSVRKDTDTVGNWWGVATRQSSKDRKEETYVEGLP